MARPFLARTLLVASLGVAALSSGCESNPINGCFCSPGSEEDAASPGLDSGDTGSFVFGPPSRDASDASAQESSVQDAADEGAADEGAGDASPNADSPSDAPPAD